jgi:hypothetical protein
MKTKGYVAEDKDSLSVRVAYIKVNISRSRQLLLRGGRRGSNANALEATTTTMSQSSVGGWAGSSASVSSATTTAGAHQSAAHSLNDVKLSVLADIGNTSFIYDMRNIKEVFVFPKIWFRRSLARRLFLGEENAAVPPQPQTPPPPATPMSVASHQMPLGGGGGSGLGANEPFRMGTDNDIDNFFRFQQHNNERRGLISLRTQFISQS